MSELDDKINQHFAGLVVRKDLVKTVKGNAIVPTYVLEYLLGQYCATNDEATIQAGIDTVREILRKHYVHRNEAGLVRSTIKESLGANAWRSTPPHTARRYRTGSGTLSSTAPAETALGSSAWRIPLMDAAIVDPHWLTT